MPNPSPLNLNTHALETTLNNNIMDVVLDKGVAVLANNEAMHTVIKGSAIAMRNKSILKTLPGFYFMNNAAQ